MRACFYVRVSAAMWVGDVPALPNRDEKDVLVLHEFFKRVDLVAYKWVKPRVHTKHRGVYCPN